MATTEATLDEVEVIYALRDVQYSRCVAVRPGSTVGEVLDNSGLLIEFPDLVGALNVGIHGERVTLDALVHDGDRIELYRPLQADPKETRRRRAAKRQRA